MIIIIHENNEWIEPFETALEKYGFDYQIWYVPEMSLDLSSTPPKAVYWNRMSASSHTRGHRYTPELVGGILAWLERHGRTVINGPKALDLEISKMRQYQELEKLGIQTPKTFCAIEKEQLLSGADKIGFPLITKHNRAGKGLGVMKFDNPDALEDYLFGASFDDSPDGITLLQEYIESPTQSIFRMEFVNGKFLYCVEVDTSQGFELCPAEACELESNCPTGEYEKFKIREDFLIPNIDAYEKFLKQNDIQIAGIEIIFDSKGGYWTYDVNTNTNYNPQAEALANQSAPEEIARYLQSLTAEAACLV
ncbi:MAG: alpha-L-glutamate ligase [Gammaproteobacteria bacterium]|nr:alpha-L-glutamate ligase [Gammaproteobacteria bacterium]MDD9957406.1 alpha-L-glutamate ligase [Gammaproteobacteria bacterium]